MDNHPTALRLSRRALVRAGALLAGAAALPFRALAALAARVPDFPTRTVEVATPAFDPATCTVRLPRPDGRGTAEEPYRLAVTGLVERELSLSYAELLALPRVERTADFHCVEGWSLTDVPWGGFAFAALAELARPLPEAKWAVFHALGTTRRHPDEPDHYVESLPLRDLADPALGCLLALTLGGEPLPDDRGAPLRLVSPFDEAYKSIKFVTRIDIAAAPVEGWWTQVNAGYSLYAPVEPDRLRGPAPKRLPYPE